MPVVEWGPPVHVAPEKQSAPVTQEAHEMQIHPASGAVGPIEGQGDDLSVAAPPPAPVAEGSESAAAASLPLPNLSAEQEAAKWNSLLVWAREQRGPQWDASTGMYVSGY